jgi:GGDEF domain-containing protein
MALKAMAGRGSAQDAAKGTLELSADARFLTLLVEGAATGVPEIGEESYLAFRGKIEELSRQLPDRLPDEEKLALIRAILHEFESYRNSAETTLREQLAGWHALLAMLLTELFASLGLDPASTDLSSLVQISKRITTADEINGWREKFNLFLHPLDGQGPAEAQAAKLRVADRSTANDNAAGLRGGGSAVEQLRRIMADHGEGFIVLFRLSCLDVVSQRFGPEAVEDCLMAVSAYLTAGLQSSDSIYHWSDSALLAILLGRPNEQILTAELNRIIAQNRESSINVAGRAIMLRIPLTFEITPISHFKNADDLLRIAAHGATKR